eukprot:712049-Pelagomonas_calceolata.AAC.2
MEVLKFCTSLSLFPAAPSTGHWHCWPKWGQSRLCSSYHLTSRAAATSPGSVKRTCRSCCQTLALLALKALA